MSKCPLRLLLDSRTDEIQFFLLSIAGSIWVNSCPNCIGIFSIPFLDSRKYEYFCIGLVYTK